MHSENLMKIARVFNVSTNYLLTEDTIDKDQLLSLGKMWKLTAA